MCSAIFANANAKAAGVQENVLRFKLEVRRTFVPSCSALRQFSCEAWSRKEFVLMLMNIHPLQKYEALRYRCDVVLAPMWKETVNSGGRSPLKTTNPKVVVAPRVDRPVPMYVAAFSLFPLDDISLSLERVDSRGPHGNVFLVPLDPNPSLDEDSAQSAPKIASHPCG